MLDQTYSNSGKARAEPLISHAVNNKHVHVHCIHVVIYLPCSSIDSARHGPGVSAEVVGVVQ